MNRFLAVVSAVMVSSVALCREPNISIFSNFVQDLAKQRGISMEESASRYYDLGVRGFDCDVFSRDLPALAASKLKPINLYYLVKFGKSTGSVEERESVLDTAERYRVPRIMVVPPNFTGGGDEEAQLVSIIAWFKEFVASSKGRGITVTIEDFGGTKNACSRMKYLKRMLDEIPDLRFALDSGNLLPYSGADGILEMKSYAGERIVHIHLKDMANGKCFDYVSLGLGVVPNEKIVKETWASGYDGWYTLENLVGDPYVDAARQIAVLRAWLSGK